MGARVMVVWCPDWPVVAALREAGMPAESARRLPAAVLERGRVGACTAAARETGVRRGMRKRDAQAGCPDLRLLDASPERDARAFEPVLAAVEELRPGVAPLRPGLLALRSPGAFYGGDAHAGAVLAEQVVAAGAWDCRVGVADDLFTAEQAARRAATQETEVVAPGGATAYLARLPVEVLTDHDLVSLLRRLGLQTLGDLAALPSDAVAARFGAEGARLHRAVTGAGAGAARLGARTPPPELSVEQPFEPPIDSVETLCFSVRRTADALVAGLAHHGLVATEVRVEVECERGPATGPRPVSVRAWLHPRCFTAADLVDRLHWQLSAGHLGGTLKVGDVRSPVTLVRFVPVVAVAEAAHAEGLWGGSTDERVARGLAKVQGMLGHEAVVRPVLQGGRGPADRQRLVPYGERPAALRDRTLPWPGRIPDPPPVRVLAEPWPAGVLTDDGRPVVVDDRGAMSGEPARFRVSAADGWQPVAAWAGPWPVAESWWDSAGPGAGLTRFQVVGVDGRAWLLALAGTEWWTEAGYD